MLNRKPRQIFRALLKPQRIVYILCVVLTTASAFAQDGHKRTDSAMSARATGTFEVKLNPQDDKSENPTPGRMIIDKQFNGDLEGTSKGQMLFAYTAVKGSGGYVAIELVTGTLKGRKGSFILQHGGTMARGVQQLAISVVPDSGTDQLVGLTGKMMIHVVDGKHSYDFEYTLDTTH